MHHVLAHSPTISPLALSSSAAADKVLLRLMKIFLSGLSQVLDPLARS